MHIDENNIERLVRWFYRTDYVLIDTCSLMDPAFMGLASMLATLRRRCKLCDTAVYVPDECRRELKKLAKHRTDADKAGDASIALHLLDSLRFRGIVKVLKRQRRPRDLKNFADNAIYTKVAADRLYKSILVITQDRKLAHDIDALNSLLSQRGRRIKICRIRYDNELISYQDEKFRENSKRIRGGEITSFPFLKKPLERKPPVPISSGLGTGKHGLIRPLKANVETIAQEKTVIAKEEPLPVLKTSEEKKKVPEKKAKPITPKNEGRLVIAQGKGRNIEAALTSCSRRGCFLFRSSDIPYRAQIHGPIDVVENDFQLIASALSGAFEGSKEFSHKGLVWQSSEINPGFVQIVVMKTAEENEAGLKPLPEKTPKQKTEKKPAKKSETKSLEKRAEDKKETVENKPKADASSLLKEAPIVEREISVAEMEKTSPDKTAEPSQKEEAKPARRIPTALTDEEFEEGTKKLIENFDYASIQKVSKAFGCGPYRAERILSRLRIRGIVSTELVSGKGFPILKKPAGTAEEAPKEPVALELPEGLTKEQYEKGKIALLNEYDYVSARKCCAVFDVGPHRSAKVIKALQEEGWISRQFLDSKGYRVLNKPLKEEAPAVVVMEDKPIQKVVSSAIETEKPKQSNTKNPSKKQKSKKKTDVQKEPEQSKGNLKDKTVEQIADAGKKAPAKKKAVAKKSEPSKKLEQKTKTQKTTDIKADSAAETDPVETPVPASSGRLIVLIPKPEETASSDRGTRRKKGPKAQKPSIPSSEQKSKPAVPSTPKPKPDSKPKASKKKTKVADKEKSNGEGTEPAQKPAKTPKPKDAKPAQKPAKASEPKKAEPAQTPKQIAPKKKPAKTPLSEAYQEAKRNEAEVDRILKDPNASPAEIRSAIDEHITRIAKLTPVEKRKLKLHKSQLELIRKSL